MVVTNPFLIDTLSDPVDWHTTFFHPWVIYPSLHFDVQFCCFFLLNWDMLTITTTSYCFCLPPKYLFHSISTSFSSQNFTNLFQVKNYKQLHPLSPSSFGWCPLPWLPLPFLCPSYRVFLPWLTSMSSPTSPSLPSCSCPLPHSSFLSLTLGQFSVLIIKACFHVLNPYLTSFAPPIAPSSPFHL